MYVMIMLIHYILTKSIQYYPEYTVKALDSFKIKFCIVLIVSVKSF